MLDLSQKGYKLRLIIFINLVNESVKIEGKKFPHIIKT